MATRIAKPAVAPAGQVRRRAGIAGAVVGWAWRVDIARLARLDAALIAGFALLGALAFFGDAPLQAFNLDGEGNLPALFSTLLLLGAALLTATLAWLSDPSDRIWRGALIFAAAFFAFMGLDEGFGLHEHVGGAMARVGLPRADWVVYYSPLFLVAAAVWLVLLRELWPNRSLRLLWLGGAACWALSQGLEAIELTSAVRDGSDAYNVLVAIEEPAEMAGSSLFGFTMLAALRSVRSGQFRRRPAS